MIRINLLPYRAERRRMRQMQFAAFGGMSLLAGLLMIGLGHAAISARIAYQGERNHYLKDETAKLDKQIEEIKKLRELTDALVSRKTIVENLQTTRSDAVHLLDQMLRILPNGIYLKTIKQNGNAINLVGYAQSSARVSTLMRSIEASPWLEAPNLVEIHAMTVNGQRENEFTLNFNLKRAAPPAPPASAAPTKPANAKG
jgi:type IV pilus assembly protein PilN